MRGHQLARVGLALGLVACGRQPQAGEGGVQAIDVLAQARALAAPVDAWRAAIDGSAIERNAQGELQGPGDDGALWVRASSTASQGLDVARGTALAGRVHLTLVGAAATPAEHGEGAVVYRDVHPSTDAVLVASDARAEIFYVLRDEAAPTSWRWQIGASPELTPVPHGDAIELRGPDGSARLRVHAPGAVDANGERLAVTTTLEDGEARFALVTRSEEPIVYPVLVDPIVEVVDWVLVQSDLSPRRRSLHALAYDSARSRVVVFGGRGPGGPLGDTWEWDGSSWTALTPAASPPARESHAMVYDASRGRAVLFGGGAGGAGAGLADTWEWDGTDWTNVTPALSPPARTGHALAYDASRARVVLFGGRSTSTFARLADTWEWDGSAWTNVTPAVSPRARDSHTMAYDAARARVVLVGGTAGSLPEIGDTWEWDGSTWTNVTPTTGAPTTRLDAGLAYDVSRGRMVLFGGSGATDVWEWDGSSWAQRSPSRVPAARFSAEMVYDTARARVVLFGGLVGGHTVSDTWEWDGSTWTEVTPSVPGRYSHAMAYDAARGRVVLFGGFDGSRSPSTWEWDGSRWLAVTPDVSPIARMSHAFAYDALRSRIVLFGGDGVGSGGGAVLGDTWEWDGTSWTDVTPAASPPARREGALAFDSSRGRAVLFGGISGIGSSPPLADTWEWDGSAWSNVTPAVRPSARGGHALVYDQARGRVVLFGGHAGGAFLGDTWEWDGSTWSDVTPAASPPARGWHALAYDSGRSQVVLYGGGNAGAWLSDVWAWDGSAWTDVSPAAGPPVRILHAMAYDSARSRLVLFGGNVASIDYSLAADTWELAVSRGQGSDCTSDEQCRSGFCVDAVCCESACGGSATDDCQACSVAAGGTADGSCTPLSVAIASSVTCRAAVGECDALETCASTSSECPEDAAQPVGSACGGAPAGPCDAQDACEGIVGASAICAARLAEPGTVCRDASCAAGTETAAASCTGTDEACPVSVESACAPYTCGADACLTRCTSSADCAEGFACEAQSCVTPSTPDAGVRDAGTGTGTTTGGCGCGILGAPSGRAAPVFFLALAWLLALRRPSRSRR